jgi:hypothetical protein
MSVSPRVPGGGLPKVSARTLDDMKGKNAGNPWPLPGDTEMRSAH